MKNESLFKKIDIFKKLATYGNRSLFLKSIAESGDPNYTDNLLKTLSDKLKIVLADLQKRTNNWTKRLDTNWQEDDKTKYNFRTSPEFLALKEMCDSEPKQISEVKEKIFKDISENHRKAAYKAYYELKK